MRTTVVDGYGYTGECFKDVGGHYPIVRIFRVIVITINGQAICTQEVFTVTVVVLIFGANIIVRNRRLERFQICYDVFVGV
jgi:hypothetical protein